jgi:hypothetical protein
MLAIRAGLISALLVLQADPASRPTSLPASRPASQPTSQSTSQPASLPHDHPVRVLAERMARTQRTPQSPEKITAFRAFLTIDPVKDDHGLQFRGRLYYSKPGMLHFKLGGDPKIAEIMFDGTTYWQVDLNGKAEELTRKETKSARDEMDRRLSLCEQIAGLLYVDQALLRMKDGKVDEVPEYRLPGDKEGPKPAVRVRGTLDRYPLYHDRDYAGRVSIDLWLRKDDLRPLAMRATPLDRLPAREGEPRRAPVTEELQFEGSETASGVLVPDLVRLYFMDRGQLQLRFSARIDELQLNPKLGQADFRPR